MLVIALMAGCVEEPNIYLRVEVKPGTSTSATGWTDSFVFIDESSENAPPGVFTLRVRDNANQYPVDGVGLNINPISACSAKTAVSCSGGMCYAEMVQSELGLCLLDVTALVADRRVDACWYMGTYARWDEPSDGEWALIEDRGCGGGTTLASAAPPP